MTKRKAKRRIRKKPFTRKTLPKKTHTQSTSEIHCTVKRLGHLEKYDERKVYASSYSACLSAHISHLKAERIADDVSHKITIWVRREHRVTSDDIFRKTIGWLKTHSKEAAFMYETHRDVS